MNDYSFFNGGSQIDSLTIFEIKEKQIKLKSDKDFADCFNHQLSLDFIAINSAPSFIQFYLVYIYQLYGSAIHS